MNIHRWLRYVQALTLLSLLLALAACGPGGTAAQTSDTPTVPPTDTPTAPPTLTPPECKNFSNHNYVSTLPDASFQATNVYAQVELPPQTLSFDNDAAGGVRGRQMCSAGTTDSVLSFMSKHLVEQ